jgi:hypothetical protein
MQTGEIPSFAELETHNVHQLGSFLQLMALHSHVPDGKHGSHFFHKKHLPSQKLVTGFWEAVRKLDPEASLKCSMAQTAQLTCAGWLNRSSFDVFDANAKKAMV